MTVYIVDLESVPTRYTGEWKHHVPKLLQKFGLTVEIIDGPADIPAATTPGAFLNFGGTNVYKASQVEKIGWLFCQGHVKSGDYFLFYDAWHPGIINLRYMAELLEVKIRIGARWHAGSYDPADFLGRLIGSKPWVRHAEKSFYHAVDNNYFATDFHIKMFFKNLLHDGSNVENPWYDQDFEEALESKKIVFTGWPMEYMDSMFESYKRMPKRDLILFPHRIAPEKQVEIFRDLKEQLPQFEFVVCQDQQLTKNEYHNLLGEAKIVFSANLQETLGISCFEGCIVDTVPMVPNRLSYEEMYMDEFKYPDIWTNTWNNYKRHRKQLCDRIVKIMYQYNNYPDQILVPLRKQTELLKEKFFSANPLIHTIKGYV